MTRKLQITLYVAGAYLGIFGFLFMFAPRLFERMTETTLPDASLTLLYGMYTMIFAFVAFKAAGKGPREKRPASELSLTILMVTLGNAVVFGYLLLKGLERFSQAGPPLMVNATLTILLALFRSGVTEHPRD